jgi:uncharacterized protein YcbX
MTSFQMSGALTLQSIHLYPVKSLAGFQVDEWPVHQRGLLYDREWMVVDPAGKFLSQRQLPAMALISTVLEKEYLRLSVPGEDDLLIPLAIEDGEKIEVEVWNDRLLADCVGTEADSRLSGFLNHPCRLVRFPGSIKRAVDPRYAEAHDEVGFADGFPFLIIGDASLRDLNRRLPTPIEMARFRPNLVVSTKRPYYEDEWRQIEIGAVGFRLPKPCSRCTITTIDPACAKRIDGEPLKTLSGYRRIGNKVFFGQNALHSGIGRLKVGDEVRIVESGVSNTSA